MTTHLASCQCGALRAECDGDPDFVVVCNCRACQKRSGSPFGTGAYFRKASARVAGEARGWARNADSGRRIENHFCPVCGTTVYWTLELRPDHLGVPYGIFETPIPDPVRVIWTEEQHSWVSFPPDWPSYPKGVPETR